MKTRKELNSLIKNQSTKLKQPKSQSTTSLIKKLTSNLSSSSDDENEKGQFYFSANKKIIRNRRRNNYVRLIRRLMGIFMFFVILILNMTLIYWNSNLKHEIEAIKEQHKTDIDSLKITSDTIQKIVYGNKSKPNSDRVRRIVSNEPVHDIKKKDTSDVEYLNFYLMIEKNFNEKLSELNKTIQNSTASLNGKLELIENSKFTEIKSFENSFLPDMEKTFYQNLTSLKLEVQSNLLKLKNELSTRCKCDEN